MWHSVFASGWQRSRRSSWNSKCIMGGVWKSWISLRK